MTVTIENLYTGNGSTTNYSFTFPYLDEPDIKASLDGVVTTNFRLLNATTVQFVNNTTDNTPTAPGTGVVIRIYRETAYTNPKATFYPGAAIRAGDLNDNTLQNLYVNQESNDKVADAWLTGDPTIISTETWYTTDDTKIATTKAIENRVTNKIKTALTGDVEGGQSITVTDNSPSDGKITVAVTAASIDTAQLATGSVTKAKIGNDQIDSEHYIAGSIDNEHLANDAVGADELGPNAVVNASVKSDAAIEFTKLENLDSTKILVGNGSNKATEVSMSGDVAISNTGATTIQAGAVERGMLAADVIDGTKIDDDAVDSDHIAAGAIDTEHIGAAQVTLAKTANLTDTQIIVGNGSNRPTAVSVSGDVTIANTGAVTIATDAINANKLANNAVTTDHIQDAELTTLAGMPSATASILADSTALTASTAELNLLDNKTFRASGDGSLTTTSDTEIPSSKVIAAHVSSTILATGGFISINNEVSFPTTANQPANGVIVSISDAAGTVINGSGTSTTGRTTDGTPATVTINNFPSSLNGETLATGVGMLVTSTGSSNIYNYHKILAAEADVKQLSDDINDFNARYRVAGSAPGSNNDAGDLYFDTAANKMKVYNGTTSQWDDVASVGNFYINTISSSSNTGGGSATFNGSAYRFTLSNPPTMAQQLIVSVNGVLQKPDAGTGQPSEGFAINGSDIIFSAAPASGSDYFIVTQGSSVSIGTPSDNTVSTAKIQNLAVNDAKIANNTIEEVSLKISNTPSDGKFLQYKDSSDKLTWATVDVTPEGTVVKSTTNGNEASTKFLRADGDGTCSWQVPPFIRNDNTSTSTGQLNLTMSGHFPLKIVNSTYDGKIAFEGSTNPYLQFREGTTNKGLIGWDDDGYFKIQNQEDSSELRIKDDFEFSNDGTTFYPVLTSNSSLSSAKLSGALPAISGANLTNLPPAGNSIELVADGAIAAGKPVIIQSNGKVKEVGLSITNKANVPAKLLQASGGYATKYQALAYSTTSDRCWASRTLSGGTYDGYGGGNVRGGFGALGNTSVPAGGGHTWDDTDSAHTDVAWDPDTNQFIIVWRDEGSSNVGKCCLGTLGGSTLDEMTFGAHTTFHNGACDTMEVVYNTSDNKVVVIFRDTGDSDKIKSIVGTVSGTGISFGTAQWTGLYCDTGVEHANVCYDSNSNKIVVVGRNTNDLNYSNPGAAAVGNPSGTSISWGTLAYFSTSAVMWPSVCFDSNLNKVVVIYRLGSSGVGHAAAGTVDASNNTISFGTALAFPGPMTIGGNDVCFDPATNNFFAWFRNSGNSLAYLLKGSVSGTSIVWADSGGTGSYMYPDSSGMSSDPFDWSIIPIKAGKIAAQCAYSSNGYQQFFVFDTQEGTTNVTDKNCIGFANTAISDGNTGTISLNGSLATGQSGLTPATRYWVQDDGTLANSIGTTQAQIHLLATASDKGLIQVKTDWTSN